MPKIYDNIQLKFADGLVSHLQTANRVDYCVGFFNLRGWGVVANGIDRLTGGMVREGDVEKQRFCRLLVGMTKTPRQEIIDKFTDPERLLMDNSRVKEMRLRLAAEFAEQLTIGTPMQKDEDTLKKLLEQLKSGRVVVKLFLRHQLHAKLYLAYQENDITPRICLLGSSNFTFSGLSLNGELNIDVIEQDAATKLENWFNDRWNDRWCIDISKYLIDVLENSWARPDLIPPYHIYLKMAYHLSREARAGLAEYKLPSAFASELLEFQQAAVKIAAHHLHNRQGVMIGDVVGLGKTITATAVAKIMEDDLFYNTLIVCPKNLVPMWEGYVYKYLLHAKVLSHSMITRDLPNLRRYKLVIIDESHNFRNNLGSGYRALRAYIAENDSKVILLSATPYNKTYFDLANQLKLFIGDDDEIGIRPERYIAALGGLVEFIYKHTDTPVKSLAAFEKSEFADDWRDVMRLYLVRRTRSFIKTNYAKDDSTTGRKYLEFANGEKSFFPNRKPKTIEFSLSQDDPNDQYSLLYDDDTVNAINALHLPRYGLIQYEAEKPAVAATSDELQIMQNLSRAGKQVLGFCRTSLYKRLESSGYAFCLSVSRHILRNHIFIYALENLLKLPVSSSVVVDMYSDGDEDELQLNLDYSWGSDDYAKAAQKYYHYFDQDMHKRFDWIRSELFDAKILIDQLRADSESLLAILHKIKVWQVKDDRKLAKLRELIDKTHKQDKVIVFTQFADTAEYLYEQLSRSGVRDIALALGGNDDIVSLVNRFSPASNQAEPFDNKTELRVLITTDVLSEGQNLQDAHVIVNFDLPWAIVRLIQRAGRVDRIGQKALEIICYSFLPEDGIEKIIGLRSKLSTRIKQNAEVVGSDEMFFDGDPVNISDLYSEKSGILDEEEDTEVDLASYAYQIWKNAIDAHPELQAIIERMPNVVFSAKGTSPDLSGSGVIVYVKSDTDNDALAWLNENGEIATQSQYAIIKAAECACDTPAFEKLSNHHELVKSCVDQILTETDTVTGTLGRKNSIKYRVYRQLERFHEENAGTLFMPPKLENALDEIFRNPLKESAIDTLSRQMKSGISDGKLAELVVLLFTERRLCNVADDENEYQVPQIICSMGLIGGGAR